MTKIASRGSFLKVGPHAKADRNTHTGVGVFHAWLFRDRADGWVSGVFHSTDARRACRRGAIGSTMGAYPRDTGSNPAEGNGHFFPSYRQLYLSSFFDTHTHTRWAHIPEVQVPIPSRGTCTFSPHAFSSIFVSLSLSLSLSHTHTHTHNTKRASYMYSCCNFLCVVLAATYLKYCRYRFFVLAICLALFFSLWHAHAHTHTLACIQQCLLEIT